MAIFGHNGVLLGIIRYRYCHKSIDNMVGQSARLCWRDRKPSFSKITVTLDPVLKSLVVQRSALLWIFSIWSISP